MKRFFVILFLLSLLSSCATTGECQCKCQNGENEPAVKKPTVSYIWPVKGTLTSKFGIRGEKQHKGIDIGSPEGTPVYAAADGKVVLSNESGDYGLLIIIQHPDNSFTVYAHNSKNLVKDGSSVKQGDKIAEVGQTGGATGPHLHFEIRIGAKPVDPLLYLPKMVP